MRKGPEYICGESLADLVPDWKESPEDVMEQVNVVLKQHGLEVITHETHSDFYAFSIVKRKGKKK